MSICAQEAANGKGRLTQASEPCAPKVHPGGLAFVELLVRQVASAQPLCGDTGMYVQRHAPDSICAVAGHQPESRAHSSGGRIPTSVPAGLIAD